MIRDVIIREICEETRLGVHQQIIIRLIIVLAVAFDRVVKGPVAR